MGESTARSKIVEKQVKLPCLSSSRTGRLAKFVQAGVLSLRAKRVVRKAWNMWCAMRGAYMFADEMAAPRVRSIFHAHWCCTCANKVVGCKMPHIVYSWENN